MDETETTALKPETKTERRLIVMVIINGIYRAV
jgi:hypothetical protein